MVVWLPRQDSNLKCLNQNQECCHYTTGDRCCPGTIGSTRRAMSVISIAGCSRSSRACTAHQTSNFRCGIPQSRWWTVVGRSGAASIGSGAWEIRETTFAGA